MRGVGQRREEVDERRRGGWRKRVMLTLTGLYIPQLRTFTPRPPTHWTPGHLKENEELTACESASSVIKLRFGNTERALRPRTPVRKRISDAAIALINFACVRVCN